MEIHGYTEHGSIDATIDGLRMTVPDDMANRHRQMIAEWEAQGNTIPPYVPALAPPTNPEDLLKQAMLDDFVERAAKNSTTAKAVKEAALAYKARK